MASSQVEIASSSPFGSVLKNRNRFRESNARAAAFQKNLKELVRDHFQNSIRVSADDFDENSKLCSRNKQVDSRVAKEQGNPDFVFSSSHNNKGNGKNSRAVDNDFDSSIMSSRESRNLDRWAAKQAREMVSSIEKQSQEAELLASSVSATTTAKENLPESHSPAAPINPGASSLVQMWENRLNRSYSLCNVVVSESGTSRISSGVSNNDSEASREYEAGDYAEDGDEARANNEDSFVDWESQSDKTQPPTTTNSDAGEREKVRIADIIKRLTNDANDHDSGTSPHGSPSRKRRHLAVMDQGEQREQKREIRSLWRVICSPKIRGRQAYADLLMQLERDRHKELEALGLRQAVSKFTHRGRLQAMLRLRFLHRGMAFQDQQLRLSAGSKSHRRSSQRAAIRNLRERFTPGADSGVTAQNDATAIPPGAEMENTSVRSEDSSTVSGLKEGGHLEEATCTRRKSAGSKEIPIVSKSEDHLKDGSPKKGIIMETTSDHQKDANPKSDVERKIINMKPNPDHRKETISETDGGQKGLSLETTSDHQKEKCPKTDFTWKGPRMDTTSDHQNAVSPKTDDRCRGTDVDKISEHHNAASPRIDFTQQGLIMDTAILDLQVTSEATTSQNDGGKRIEITENQETKLEQHIHDRSLEVSQPTPSLDGRNVDETADKQEANVLQQFRLDSQENGETTTSLNDWDENELAEEEEEEEEETYLQDQFLETNYDWISEISRPRSYWENRRQTWYQEMLNSSTQNDEIRQLLERRRVSTSLCSDFRERMDQLMTSRVQRQTELEAYQEEEEEEMSQERVAQLLLAHLQRHIRSEATQEGDQVEQLDEPTEVEEEEEEEDEEEEEEEQEPGHREENEEEDEHEQELSPISTLFHEASDDLDQISPSVHNTSPSTTQTWSYQDHEVGDESDPLPSTSSPRTLPSQAYYQNSRQSSSSTNRITIETDLIYDLRGQIEQLHREMSELRKIVQSCMSMQGKSHQSSQQEAHPVQGMGNNSLCGASKKRICCICYEMQVDSLLYRCGHMCTCLKCAYELQWSSGKCPICRAPIDDVVRAFMDT